VERRRVQRAAHRADRAPVRGDAWHRVVGRRGTGHTARARPGRSAHRTEASPSHLVPDGVPAERPTLHWQRDRRTRARFQRDLPARERGAPLRHRAMARQRKLRDRGRDDHVARLRTRSPLLGSTTQTAAGSSYGRRARAQVRNQDDRGCFPGYDWRGPVFRNVPWGVGMRHLSGVERPSARA